MAGARPFVDKKLKQRPVMLFSKKHSPECKQIRKMMEEYDFPPNFYEVCDIDAREDCTQIENYFQVLCLSDRREVPRLFVNGKYIGGPDEIPRLHESRKLAILLTDAVNESEQN